MGELTSIREIARGLLEKYRGRIVMPVTVEEDEEVQAVMDKLVSREPKPLFDGLDREFLRKMGINE